MRTQADIFHRFLRVESAAAVKLNKGRSTERIQTWLLRSLRRPRLTSSYASSFLPRQLRVKPFMASVSGAGRSDAFRES